MPQTPTLQSRVWNLLRTARSLGHSGVGVAILAGVLGTSPEMVLTSVMPEMMDGTIHCDVSGEETALVPRRGL